MEVDGKNENSHNSFGGSSGRAVQSSDLNFCVGYLKEQITYLQGKVIEKSEEIDKKDAIIRRIEAEKSEISQKFYMSEANEHKIKSELEILKVKMTDQKEEVSFGESPCQDQNMLDADGIKCFSLSDDGNNEDSNIMSSVEEKSELVGGHDKCKLKQHKIQKLISNLKKEVELLTDNGFSMKNEIRMLNESERMKTEELDSAENEITKLKDEIVFFKESNKDLINSIDEVEKTLHDIER